MGEDLTIPKQYRYVSVALSPEEKWDIDRLAAASGMSTSNFVRDRLGLPLVDKPSPKQPKVR